MPSRKFTWDPQHWRFRAEEVRTVADQMTHEGARTIMRRLANNLFASPVQAMAGFGGGSGAAENMRPTMSVASAVISVTEIQMSPRPATGNHPCTGASRLKRSFC
jgi:hypothetical protein